MTAGTTASWHQMAKHRSFRLTATPSDDLASQPLFAAREKFSHAIVIALAQQVPVLILAALILDGGLILRFCGIAAIAAWVFTLTILLRRPKEPTNIDLAVIKYSFWPAMLLILVVGFVMQSLPQ
jgi:hypothetical protein